MLGRPVARMLASQGFHLYLLARDEQKMQQLFPDIPFIKGDVMDMPSLDAAMKGKDAVYINLSILQSTGKKEPQPEREGMAHIIAAAKAAGIKRIAYLSSIIQRYQGMNGFNWWGFTIKQQAIKQIKDSGIPWSIFYPSAFMETIDKQMIQGNKIMLAGTSRFPMWYVAADDYGRQVAKALSVAGTANQEYAVQGPEAFTIDEAAVIFLKHYKHPLKTMKAPLWMLRFFGIFSKKMSYVANICDALNNYPEKFESEKTWADLGRPVITLAQYAAAL